MNVKEYKKYDRKDVIMTYKNGDNTETLKCHTYGYDRGSAFIESQEVWGFELIPFKDIIKIELNADKESNLKYLKNKKMKLYSSYDPYGLSGKFNGYIVEVRAWDILFHDIKKGDWFIPKSQIDRIEVAKNE